MRKPARIALAAGLLLLVLVPATAWLAGNFLRVVSFPGLSATIVRESDSAPLAGVPASVTCRNRSDVMETIHLLTDSEGRLQLEPRYTRGLALPGFGIGMTIRL